MSSRVSGKLEDPISGLSTGILSCDLRFSVRSRGRTAWNTEDRGHGIMFQQISGKVTYFGINRNEEKASAFMTEFDFVLMMIYMINQQMLQCVRRGVFILHNFRRAQHDAAQLRDFAWRLQRLAG
jgi:hypothetical protein